MDAEEWDQIRTGLSDETGVVILDGLKEGDTVITGPYRAVKTMKHGDLVRKQEDTSKEKGKDAKDDANEDAVKVEVD